MDGQVGFDPDAGARKAASAVMEKAIACLAGARVWQGSVNGVFGVVKRRFEIRSEGVFEEGALSFAETLSFDDGEVQERAWRLIETPEGLGLEGENVSLLKPGRLAGDGFEITYKVKFGSMWFDYLDRFAPRADGGVDNEGFVKLFGVTVMKIDAQAGPAQRVR